MAETTIGLAGNPNCGKTTLFNELTGSNGYVGNWPGVTVEKKQAVWRADRSVTFVDLPGIYSLSPYTPEEVVSRDYVVGERPDAVINLVDVTNLERNLYLTTQLLEAGRPVVVGLNMCDLLKEKGDVVDTAALSKRLGVPVVEVSALRATNLDTLVKKAVAAGQTGKVQPGAPCFSPLALPRATTPSCPTSRTVPRAGSAPWTPPSPTSGSPMRPCACSASAPARALRPPSSPRPCREEPLCCT